MLVVEHDDTVLSDSARSQIAELERRFDCVVEIRQGICGVGGALLPGDAGEVEQRAAESGDLVRDADRPAVQRLVEKSLGIEHIVTHFDVFLARLRFANGRATPSMCPAPTADACVEFLVFVSERGREQELWAAQGADS